MVANLRQYPDQNITLENTEIIDISVWNSTNNKKPVCPFQITVQTNK